MALLRRKEQEKPQPVEKLLDVDASMQGNLTFKDPVNLRINGTFDGVLDTRGSLIISEKATVRANIRGETILIGGDVTGDVKATSELTIRSTGRLVGDIETPVISIETGAVFHGKIDMMTAGSAPGRASGRAGSVMNVDEIAAYLAVEKALIFEWADSGKLPGVREGSGWRFDKSKVDEWVASGRIK